MSTERTSPRVLRPKPWMTVGVIVINTSFLVGAAAAYAQSGWSPTFIGFGLLSAVGLAAILELVLCRVVLQGDLLETRGLFHRRRYSASEIQSVKWEWGSGVVLELSGGGWGKLPELGYNSQSLANTLRAWLKSCRAGKE
jgi:hypothetical protein